ncbi:alpha-ketoglutarate-dependent dioxygenase AlkB family protein [Shewanella marina]|uniref:alpha-ketoglutarate-dependent dioxygenase AlkB family protein n=1 Tax=Shewanella marina TaxID=487319 RepID=UPI00046F3CAD|nr:alpha-ketoglutarate-dependent dioxygenase AlkB [Shewanella marina]
MQQADLFADKAPQQLPFTHIANYLNLKQRQLLLAEAETYPFSQPIVTVYGKQHPIPRQQVWFADTGCHIKFSHTLIAAQTWRPMLTKLRQKLLADFEVDFNGVLVNQYRNGLDQMGMHCDDEPEIVPQTPIVSISLGASRDFVVQHKQTKQRHMMSLNDGDLVLMPARMQQTWLHGIPKRSKVMQMRLNYTFRQIIAGYHQDSF